MHRHVEPAVTASPSSLQLVSAVCACVCACSCARLCAVPRTHPPPPGAETTEYNHNIIFEYGLEPPHASFAPPSLARPFVSRYVGSIEAICGPTLEGFLAVLVAVAVSSLSIVVACIALVKLKQYSNQETTSPIHTGGSPSRRGYSRRGKKGGEYDPLVSETYFGPA